MSAWIEAHPMSTVLLGVYGGAVLGNLLGYWYCMWLIRREYGRSGASTGA